MPANSIAHHASLAHPANGLRREDRRFAIGDLAREFGVTLRTLRFYEDRGLLTPLREGSSRVYSARDKVRLGMILKGKQLGFTLTEIRELLGAETRDPDGSLELALKPEQVLSQIAHLERQRSDIDDAIQELRAAHQRMSEPQLARSA
jgi:DNA-binding transcriptional MerR regulator